MLQRATVCEKLLTPEQSTALLPRFQASSRLQLQPLPQRVSLGRDAAHACAESCFWVAGLLGVVKTQSLCFHHLQLSHFLLPFDRREFPLCDRRYVSETVVAAFHRCHCAQKCCSLRYFQRLSRRCLTRQCCPVCYLYCAHRDVRLANGVLRVRFFHPNYHAHQSLVYHHRRSLLRDHCGHLDFGSADHVGHANSIDCGRHGWCYRFVWASLLLSPHHRISWLLLRTSQLIDQIFSRLSRPTWRPKVLAPEE